MLKDKKTYRILVIEDNTGDFTKVEDFLIEQFADPVITRAINFKQVCEILSSDDSIFDVILLDLTLPDKSGQYLINEMLQLAPLYPIIILTGYTDIYFSIRSISSNIADYLLKDELTAAMLYKSIIYTIERNKNISEIKKSEKRYSDLFRLSPQPMWLYDPETYRFIQVNKAAIKHYGFSEEEFLNMTILEIRPEEDIQTTKDVVINNKVKNEGTYAGRFSHCKKSGEIIKVEIYSTPIIISDKEFKSVIAIDITEKLLHEDKLIQAILKTQEDERYEIGGELHDNICQILAVSQMSLDKLSESLPSPKTVWFDKCRNCLSLALDEIRNLSHRMAPAFFNDTTVEEAFRKLFHPFNIDDRYKIILRFDDKVKEYPINVEIQLNLYRILQEQLRNISKYAHAAIIEVDVFIIPEYLRMIVLDNGIGFTIDSAKEGIGLTNMKRRAELVGGKLEIESSPGNGCKIIVDIPLQQIK